MTFYRPGNAVTRLNKYEDSCFTDEVGSGSAWLPVQRGDVVGIATARAALTATSNATLFNITKFAEYPQASFVLEMKQGGEDNSEAWPIEQWEDTPVHTAVTMVFAGYVRLKVAALDMSTNTGGNVSAQGVALRIFVDKSLTQRGATQ